MSELEGGLVVVSKVCTAIYHRIWHCFHILVFFGFIGPSDSSFVSLSELGDEELSTIFSLNLFFSLDSETLLFFVSSLLTTSKEEPWVGVVPTFTRLDIEGTRKNQTLLNSAWLILPIRLISTSSSGSGSGTFFCWMRHFASFFLKLASKGLKVGFSAAASSDSSGLFLVGSFLPEGPFARDLFGLFKFSDAIKLASCNENIKKEFTFKNLYEEENKVNNSQWGNKLLKYWSISVSSKRDKSPTCHMMSPGSPAGPGSGRPPPPSLSSPPSPSCCLRSLKAVAWLCPRCWDYLPLRLWLTWSQFTNLSLQQTVLLTALVTLYGDGLSLNV